MSPIFKQTRDELFYRQALDFVHKLRDELSSSGIHVLELPSKKSPFTFQFADASPPPKPDDTRRVQVVSVRKKITGSMRDFFNVELARSAKNGMIVWDDGLYRKKHIGMREDEDGFTALCLPYSTRTMLGHRGDIATALNELEVAIQAKLTEVKKTSPGHKK